MPDTEPYSDATHEAFERGKRRAYVDAELDSHERRLNRINGSIDRQAAVTTAHTRSIDKLISEVGSLKEALQRKDREENDKERSQIDTRTFVVSVLAVVVMLLGVIVSVLLGAHVI